MEEQNKNTLDKILETKYDTEDDYRPVVIDVNHVTMEFALNTEKVDNLKEFVIRKLKGNIEVKKFKALNDVNFQIKKGEHMAIMGLNGAGKSTLLKSIVGVYKPTSGYVAYKGVMAPLIELGAGFDPEYSGKENIYLYGAILGYSREYLDKKIDEIIEFSELGKFINVPLKNYSSGMKARLGFSIATAVEPDILILDEVLSVGDAKFRQKSLAKVRSLFASGVTVLFVSHNVQQVLEICDTAVLLDHGSIIAKGPVKDVVKIYEEKIGKKPAAKPAPKPAPKPEQKSEAPKQVEKPVEKPISKEETKAVETVTEEKKPEPKPVKNVEPKVVEKKVEPQIIENMFVIGEAESYIPKHAVKSDDKNPTDK